MMKSYPKLALPAGRPLRSSGMCGDWRNTDRTGAGGILELSVTEDEATLTVRGLGQARPAPYAWHRVHAASYAADPSSSEAWSFLADYDFGFMRTIVSTYHKLGILIATTYNIFSDGSERTDYWTREFFHRRVGAAPEATTPPVGISRARDRRDGAAHGQIDSATMIGRWVNFDRDARGIVGVTVRAHADRLAVAIDALGPDGVRRWPELPGFAMADNTGGGPAIGFVATGDLFGERSEGPHLATLCAYLNRGLLTIDAHLADLRGPTNVMTRTHLHLAEDA
jgi:hypothetical protein